MATETREHIEIKPASPLPWRYTDHINGPDSSATCGVAGSDGMVLCDVWADVGDSGYDPDLADENARYIVHAANCYPDLLAALKAAQQFLGIEIQRGPDSDGWVNTCALVEDAIAKAEGRDA